MTLLNLPLFVLALAPLASVTGAHSVHNPKVAYGFIGFGINMYEPLCGSVCSSCFPRHMMCPPDQAMPDMGMAMIATGGSGVLSLGSLGVSDNGVGVGGGGSAADQIRPGPGISHNRRDDMPGMAMPNSTAGNSTGGLAATTMPTTECIANNKPFLQSVAYCMKTHCPDSVSDKERQDFWDCIFLGREVGQPHPFMTYAELLADLDTPPTDIVEKGQLLNKTMLVNETTYHLYHNADRQFGAVEVNHAIWGLVILISTSFLPLLLTLLRLLPLPKSFVTRFRGIVIDAPLLSRPASLPGLGRLHMMTRGHALFIFYIVVINFLACLLGTAPRQPNAFYETASREQASYIANRTGVISFANLAVLILFAGRNNFMLWLTGWSRPTFLLLHRAVAWAAVLQACLHAAMYVQLYRVEKYFTEESQKGYWAWGVVAVLCFCILLPASMRVVRSMSYEFFLVAHIGFAVFVLIGCYYHIILRYARQWGYESWIYISIALWAFDRVWRSVRLSLGGYKHAFVYKIDDDYLRVDIPDARGSLAGIAGYVYAYFPDLTWKDESVPKPWESHPFSVAINGCTIPVSSSGPAPAGLTAGDSDSDTRGFTSGTNTPMGPTGGLSEEKEKIQPTGHSRSNGFNHGRGMTLFIRVGKGITAALARHASPLPVKGEHGTAVAAYPRGIPILLENYRSGSLLEPAGLGWCNRLQNKIYIAGGSGISGVLGHVLEDTYGSAQADKSRVVKLFWGVRTLPLVSAVEDAVVEYSAQRGVELEANWDRATPGSPAAWGAVDVSITVGERMFLAELVERHAHLEGGTAFITCGPREMVEEMRALVASQAASGAVVGFVEESFEW